MKPRISRRRFLHQTGAAMAVAGTGLGAAPAALTMGRRVFLAGFSHETNTFHPVPTGSFSYTQAGELCLEAWQDSGLVLVPGVSAYPTGGGTIAEPPCREATDKVVDSLRAALPVDAVFLRLHGAMYGEGVGPAEPELVGMVRRLVGSKVPIACTFDLHGNISARLGELGDILVGLKTAPHSDDPQAAELAGRILLDTLAGRVRPVSYVLPIPMILPGEKAMTTAEPFHSLVEEARRQFRFGCETAELEEGVTRALFEPCGLDPLNRKLVVVKEGYLFPGLTRIAPRYIMLLTPGAGDMRLERLRYTRRRISGQIYFESRWKQPWASATDLTDNHQFSARRRRPA